MLLQFIDLFIFNCLNTFNDLSHSICFLFWHRFLLLQEAFKKELDTHTESIVFANIPTISTTICCPRLENEKQIKIYLLQQTQMYVKNQYYEHRCDLNREITFIFIHLENSHAYGLKFPKNCM